eukprot:NODE_2857_length_442_cov_558.038168_g2371_i0.p2 GENE.NODE_2857_length_442_cov_558.038168_g2371_i0~~NODE_2857_length_442_cov_558.038168_g2371_i0.p2  ORF type:complete len:89 (+),score=38.56 NODE_2857_length_442_cov_558.038168_g2371_i0:28-267(+)
MGEAAETRVYGQPAPRKVLSKDEQKDSVDKLTAKALEKKKEKEAKLEGLYGFKRKEFKKVGAAEADAIFGGLASPKGKA